MKKILSATVLSLLVLAFAAFQSSPEDKSGYGYVGAEKCGMCHKSEKQGRQLSIWQESKHSKAFRTLQSKQSDSIAQARGYKTPAAQTEDCLKCHSSGYNADASLKGPKFKIEDGVQCETCHGPGSDYQALKVMKNRQEAIEKGLIVHSEKEKFCTGCHNSESPTFTGFEYEKLWAKIAHPVPTEAQK